MAAELPALEATGGFGDLSDELTEAILEGAGKFAREVIAPLNVPGDQQGVSLANDRVRTADGFADAYRAYVEAGWSGIAGDPEYGGQGLPLALANAVEEMMISGCMAFSLCATLTHGAVEAIDAHGTPEQKQLYLSRLITGEWSGTMNLTEPQAGSDVGALTSRAAPRPDGSHAITGGKIFITFGEHEMSQNIIHLVLARLPGAPSGTRGISLFIVPKYLPDAEGKPGKRNDLRCIGLEDKMGIHATPTCVMAYGENDGAVGYLLGEKNRGMSCMFTMMNAARLNVGLSGVAVGERAYQQALAYALERKQGKPLTPPEMAAEGLPIAAHADVRRMLLSMKALVQGARAICYANAGAMDMARKAPDPETRAAAQARADLLTPISKAWGTDIGVEVASLGVQVHGGMGFIEETGAAQYLRDIRIAPIYEGTNGIQAIDMVARKLPMQGGAVMRGFIAEMQEIASRCRQLNHPGFAQIGDALDRALADMTQATGWLLARTASAPNDCLAGATPYLKLAGTVSNGYYLARLALAGAQTASADPQAGATLSTALFYALNYLPQSSGLSAAAMAGAAHLYALNNEQLGG
ncbi:MAG: acyl-CoA dehydrogenase [Alphaproteobacteria bacterium]|nr:acyl-CoA dehydrogenase [Alphaproteobacteria bacterium]